MGYSAKIPNGLLVRVLSSLVLQYFVVSFLEFPCVKESTDLAAESCNVTSNTLVGANKKKKKHFS